MLWCVIRVVCCVTHKTWHCFPQGVSWGPDVHLADWKKILACRRKWYNLVCGEGSILTSWKLVITWFIWLANLGVGKSYQLLWATCYFAARAHFILILAEYCKRILILCINKCHLPLSLSRTQMIVRKGRMMRAALRTKIWAVPQMQFRHLRITRWKGKFSLSVEFTFSRRKLLPRCDSITLSLIRGQSKIRTVSPTLRLAKEVL